MSKALTTILLFFLSFSLLAEPNNFQSQSKELHLSSSRAWLNILHYEDGVSYVDDDAFFLAQDGKTNPEAELQQTIVGLFKSPKAYCQFPYRRQWLISQMPDLADALPTRRCDNYDKWRSHVAAHSVTLVLASSFLNSPSSMYGHTFLRFDRAEQSSDLNAYAVSFGATITDGGGLMYAYNGLFGGYPGKFADAPYHKKVKEYSRLDNRDIWEYKLNLSPEETDRLVTHLWEMNNITFDYFFFDENCSFRLLELIQVARPSVALTEQFGLSAIPIDTIRVVDDANLVERVNYRPSNQQKLQHNLNQLHEDDQNIAWALAEGQLQWSELSFDANVAGEGQRAYQIAELAYHYLRYKNNRKARKQVEADRSLVLLRAMNRWSEYRVDTPVPVPDRPDRGHESRSLSLYAGYAKPYKNGFVDLEWKASYHDMLDNLFGYPRFISLNLAQAKLRLYDVSKIRIQQLNVLEISSLSPSSRFFTSNSWRTRLGFERLNMLAQDGSAGDIEAKSIKGFSTWFAEGAYGKTWPLFGHLNGFVLGNARFEINNAMKHDASLGLGAQLGLLYQTDSLSWIAEARGYQFVEDKARIEGIVGVQWPLARNHGLRLSAHVYDFGGSFDDYQEASLAWRWHFR